MAQTRDSSRIPPVIQIGGYDDEQLRLRQLFGDTTLSGSMLRSVSTLSPALTIDSTARFGISWRIVPPQYRYVYNSALPYSLNDGALWAGRGSSGDVIGGVRAAWGMFRLFLVPELAASENRDFKPPKLDTRIVPPLPGRRNKWSSPWHAGPQSIDLPWRFGDKARGPVTLGQSSLILDTRGTSIGFSTENEWWGPGIRNALILSNNARGFPHLFVRPLKPLVTKVGTFEGHFLAGWLHESPFFDTDTTNDYNSISMVALTYQPPRAPVVFGFARSVFAPSCGNWCFIGHMFNVVNDVGQPNARSNRDSTMHPGQDQLLSLFFRWVEPRDRFEFYGEWARAEFPVSFRDFMVQPDHTQGYTLGLQWVGDTLRWNMRLRAQAEVTFLEQSTTYRQRAIGSWYTSRAVSQGYTNEGQVLGAAIGPGSSSQFISFGALAPKWQLSAYLNRIRWMEDVHSQFVYNYDQGNRGFCEHDVSLLPGFRASAQTRVGSFQADYSSGWRLNVFFDHPGTCLPPVTFPGDFRDERTNSLSVTWVPRYF